QHIHHFSLSQTTNAQTIDYQGIPVQLAGSHRRTAGTNNHDWHHSAGYPAHRSAGTRYSASGCSGNARTAGQAIAIQVAGSLVQIRSVHARGTDATGRATLHAGKNLAGLGFRCSTLDRDCNRTVDTAIRVIDTLFAARLDT